MKHRLSFARQHRQWELDDWKTIIFTDESTFKLVQANGRVFIRRKEDEALQEDTVQYSSAWAKSVMVWGAISHAGVGPLVKVEGTIDGEEYLNLFRYRLWRWYPGLYDQSMLFQDDNARPHLARPVNSWFEKYNILRMDWPSKSPDCNIIEDIWNHMKFQLRGKLFENEDELWEELCKEWRNVPNDLIHSLYSSLPSRMEAVIKAKGGITKY